MDESRKKYYLRHPRDQFFYWFLAVMTTMTGVGEQTWWGYDAPHPIIRTIYKCQSILNHAIGPILFSSQVLFLYLHYKDLSFDERGIIFTLIPVTFLANMNIFTANLKSTKRVTKIFMRKYHVCNFENPDENINDIRVYTEIVSRLASYFLTFFLMSDWFAWSFITVYNNYKFREQIKNQTMAYQTMLYCVWPVDYRHDFKYWLIIHIINVYILFIGCFIITLRNSLNYAFVVQIIGHIKILKYKLRTQFVGDFSDKEIKEKLIDLIKYHTFVVSVFADVQEAFGLNVTTNYVYNLVADSMLLYQLMVGAKDNYLMFGCMLAAYLGGLVVLSFVLEEIRRQSDVLSDLVYYLPWEEMSCSNRKMFCLILMRVQKPMVFTSTGGLECGVKPMISIIQSTFSYYVMLKSTVEKE